MSARSLVVGFDGADLELVFALGKRELPNLFALMERGVYAHQQSVLPPATLPNWTTFLTALDPGQHGVFDFTLRRGYGVRFTAGTVREAPTLFARLDRLGLACCAVGFPATYPPERLRNGVFISGWDAPVSFEADRSFVWPRSLHALLERRFGPLRFDEVDQFQADRPGFHEELGDKLVDKIERRSELARFLLAYRKWDLFAFYFGESDTAAHYLWSLHDEGSPRRPSVVSERERTGLTRVYSALDRALGELVRAAGDDAEITLVSDHGSGGSSDKVFYLNRALEAAGLLRFHRRGTSAPRLKQFALRKLGPRLRDRVFRFGGAVLPSVLESRARFGAIDMAHTYAFSDELNYFPAVHLNLRGREPRGIVAASEADAVRARVRAELQAIRDPFSGRPIVSRVYMREELFVGPHVERAPDLLLELRLDRGYSYNLMPSQASEPRIVRRLEPGEYLGRKGRSLPGSHRPRGLFVAAGPSVRPLGAIEIDIAHASAAVLSRAGVGLPSGATAGASFPWLAERREVSRLPDVAVASKRRGDTSALERRLRALGYID